MRHSMLVVSRRPNAKPQSVGRPSALLGCFRPTKPRNFEVCGLSSRLGDLPFAKALDRLQSLLLNILAPAARRSKASDPRSAHAQ